MGTPLPPDDYFADPDFQRLEALFHDYVAQGEGRNISWLVSKVQLPLATVARGMVKGMWPQRIQAIGPEAAVAVQAKLVGDVAEMNGRDVQRLCELEDAAWSALQRAIKEDRVKPDTLWRIFEGAQSSRRKKMGLDEGGVGDLASRLGKLLESSVGEETSEAKPFVLDRKMLEMPPDLPAAPGMTSDAVDPKKRPLEDSEKEALRP